MTEQTAGAPAYVLIASGVITLLYSIAYALWSFVAMIPMTVGTIGSIMDGSNTVVDGIMAWFALNIIPLMQTVGFAVIGVMALVVIFGGVRLNAYRSKGLVWLAILCAPLAPVASLFINAGSALNLGALGMGCITGCLLGNIPTVFVLLVGLVAAIFAAVHLFGEQAQEAYGA